MFRVPNSRPEGTGFETLQELVGGSVLIQPPCRKLCNFIHLISPAPAKPRRRLRSTRSTCGGGQKELPKEGKYIEDNDVQGENSTKR